MRYLEDESTYILANYGTGDTVTINVYRLSDNTQVVTSAGMLEIGVTGRFKYSFSQAVGAKTEYLYVTTNSVNEQQGKIILGGYPSGIKDETDKIQTGIINAKNDYKAIGFATENPPSQVLNDYKANVTNLDVAVSSRNNITPPTVNEIKTKMEEEGSNLDFIKKIEGGKWELVSNQMIFYKDDNITEIARFNLFDESGSPSMNNVFKRERI